MYSRLAWAVPAPLAVNACMARPGGYVGNGSSFGFALTENTVVP
jgi:hypothetical protein